ncbi:unnamed protein product, partial [Staurois parvus]
ERIDPTTFTLSICDIQYIASFWFLHFIDTFFIIRDIDQCFPIFFQSRHTL